MISGTLPAMRYSTSEMDESDISGTDWLKTRKHKTRCYSPGFNEPDDGRDYPLEYFDEGFEKLFPDWQ